MLSTPILTTNLGSVLMFHFSSYSQYARLQVRSSIKALPECLTRAPNILRQAMSRRCHPSAEMSVNEDVDKCHPLASMSSTATPSLRLGREQSLDKAIPSTSPAEQSGAGATHQSNDSSAGAGATRQSNNTSTLPATRSGKVVTRA